MRRLHEWKADAVRVALAAASLALFACGPAPPPPPLSEPAPAPAPPPPPLPPAPPPVALPDMNLPPGPIYACASAAAREPIVLAPGVESLCRRHPEMGPCQFERDACRARGGRVYTSAGEEVTAEVERIYDERVRRVRFQADADPKKR